MNEQLQLSVVNVYKGAYIIFEGRPSNGKFFILKKDLKFRSFVCLTN